MSYFEQWFDITKILRIHQDFFHRHAVLTKTYSFSVADLFDFVKESVTMENVPVNVS
jgi:hypothetical protein